MTTKRKSSATKKQPCEESTDHLDIREHVIALKKQISSLAAENKGLREQIAAMSNVANRPAESHKDSVREQQHNFFKYSNTRRY